MNKDFVIKNTRNYDEWLIEQLKDPEEALAYLEAALEEYIADNDVNALGCAVLNFFHAQYLTLQLTSLTGIYINNFERYGGSQCLDHETGKIRCIQTDAVGSDQSTKCSSAGVR